MSSDVASVSSGTLRRGRAFPDNVTAASIPPKTDPELFPHRTIRKNDGFGYSQSRFPTAESESTPGPGTYYKPSSFDTTSESVSKRGMGNGFASKTKRFGRSKKEHMPGPGAHVPASLPSKQDFSTAHSRTFAQPIRDEVNRKAPVAPAPGPGAYNAPSTLSKLDPARSAFASKTQRNWYEMASAPLGGGVKLSDIPVGPGQYNPVDIHAEDAHKYAAAFKSNEPRIYSRSVTDVPGPGEYLPQGSLLKDRGSMHPSSVLPPEKSRAPRSDVKRPEPLPLPGPGTYEPELLKSGAGIVSAFKSTTSRDKNPLEEHLPLGPGTYNPPALQKESFIFNRDQKWI